MSLILKSCLYLVSKIISKVPTHLSLSKSQIHKPCLIPIQFSFDYVVFSSSVTHGVGKFRSTSLCRALNQIDDEEDEEKSYQEPHEDEQPLLLRFPQNSLLCGIIHPVTNVRKTSFLHRSLRDELGIVRNENLLMLSSKMYHVV